MFLSISFQLTLSNRDKVEGTARHDFYLHQWWDNCDIPDVETTFVLLTVSSVYDIRNGGFTAVQFFTGQCELCDMQL